VASTRAGRKPRRITSTGTKPSKPWGCRSSVSGMSVGAAIALGAVVGLALGVLVSVTTDVPLGPELGLVLGAVIGWLSRRNRG
jgi:hypothetical protein